MMEESEIRKALAEIEKDERIHYKTALVQINAPLALIQLSLRTQANAFRWVLGMGFKRYGEEDESI